MSQSIFNLPEPKRYTGTRGICHCTACMGDSFNVTVDRASPERVIVELDCLDCGVTGFLRFTVGAAELEGPAETQQ